MSMKHKKQLFLILILTFLLVGLTTLAATNITSKSNTDTSTSTAKNTEITSTTNTINKNTTKIQTNTDKENTIQKTIKGKNKKEDDSTTVYSYADLSNALKIGSGTKIINIGTDIILEGNSTINSSINMLTINGNKNTINGDGKYQFLAIDSEQSVIINNLTITNCYSNRYGGAINNNGSLDILDSNLNSNIAIYSGGAINNEEGSTLTIINTTLTNNTSTGGGAIENKGSLTITESNLTYNTVTSTNGDGGAVNNWKGILSIKDSNLNNNHATGTYSCGGAVSNYIGIVTITNTNLTNNTAENGGGAISFDEEKSADTLTTLNITNSNFNYNIAIKGGAICTVYGEYGYINLINNTFKGNNATEDKETLNLGPKNMERKLEKNTYDDTDIKLKTVNLTTQYKKTIYQENDNITLIYDIILENPDNYDVDVVNNIYKTLYINSTKESTIKGTNYTLSQLKSGEYLVYYRTCNSQSNNLTLSVMANSQIKTDKTTYDHIDGLKTKITLNITDPNEENGNIVLSVKNQDKYTALYIYPNVKTGYHLSTESIVETLENVYDTLNSTYTINVTYTSNSNLTKPSSTEFKLNIIKNRNTTTTIKSIQSSIGSQVNLTAAIVDENKNNVTAGKVLFKVNGITLKDENGNVIYAIVNNGQATIKYKVQEVWIKNTTTIQAVYSGENYYKSSRSNATTMNITKGKATLTLEKTSITAKTGQTITLRAKVMDSKGARINNDKVVFKLNGRTLTDKDGKTLYARVVDGEAVLEYTIPENYNAKTYNLTAVFGGNYYERIQTQGTLKLEKKATTITPESISTTNGKTTIKAQITDETDKPLVTSTKIAIKINGKTITSTNSTNGTINTSFTTTLKPGTYELTIISGENGQYKTGKMTTILKI